MTDIDTATCEEVLNSIGTAPVLGQEDEGLTSEDVFQKNYQALEEKYGEKLIDILLETFIWARENIQQLPHSGRLLKVKENNISRVIKIMVMSQVIPTETWELIQKRLQEIDPDNN